MPAPFTADSARQLAVAGEQAVYEAALSSIQIDIKDACSRGKTWVCILDGCPAKIKAAESLLKNGFNVEVRKGYGCSKHINISW